MAGDGLGCGQLPATDGQGVSGALMAFVVPYTKQVLLLLVDNAVCRHREGVGRVLSRCACAVCSNVRLQLYKRLYVLLDVQLCNCKLIGINFLTAVGWLSVSA